MFGKGETLLCFLLIMKSKRHYTKDGIELIKKLKGEMHKGGSLGAGNPHAQWERNINRG